MATIKVAVRCRPFSVEDKLGVHMVQRGEEDGEINLLHSYYPTNRFAFSYSWWSAYGFERHVQGSEAEIKDMKLVNQEQVYNTVGRQVLSEFLEGDPVVLFAYGLSGSGKTYTVFGTDAIDSQEAWFKFVTPQNSWGVFPRIAHQVFEMKQEGWEISIRYFQNIVNDVRDLLNPVGAEKHYKSGLHKDESGFMEFDWVSSVTLDSFQDLVSAIGSANRRKAIAATQFNWQSTRGHCILQLEVSKPHSHIPNQQMRCRLYVCDLAGTEPAADIHASIYERVQLNDGSQEYKYVGHDPDNKKTADLQNQGKKINLSLTEMSQFFMKMAAGIKAKKLKPGDTIPGCNSYFLCKYLKETMLHAKTYLFCAIRPELKFQKYTYATLGFAKNASVVKLKPKKLLSTTSKVDELSGEIETLRKIIANLEEENAVLKQQNGPARKSSIVKEEKAAAEEENFEDQERKSQVAQAQPRRSSKVELWETERQVYQARGIQLTYFSEEDGKSQEPHLLVLDPEPFRSERFMYMLTRETTTFGEGCDIWPKNPTVVPRHCTVSRAEDHNSLILTLTREKGAVYHNGKLVLEGESACLLHHDRVVMGTELTIFIDPSNAHSGQQARMTVEDVMKEYEQTVHRKRSSVFNQSILLPLTQLPGGSLEECDSSDEDSLSDREQELGTEESTAMKDLEETIIEGNHLLAALDCADINLKIVSRANSLSEESSPRKVLVSCSADISIVLDSEDIEEVIETLQDNVNSLRGALEKQKLLELPRLKHPIELLFDTQCPSLGLVQIHGEEIFSPEFLSGSPCRKWYFVQCPFDAKKSVGKLLLEFLCETSVDDEHDQIQVGANVGKPIGLIAKVIQVDALPYVSSRSYCTLDIQGDIYTSDLDAIGKPTSGPIELDLEVSHFIPSIPEPQECILTVELFAAPKIGASLRKALSTANPTIAQSLGFEDAVIHKPVVDLLEMEILSSRQSWINPPPPSPSSPWKNLASLIGGSVLETPRKGSVTKFEPVLLVSIMSARDLPFVPDHRDVNPRVRVTHDREVIWQTPIVSSNQNPIWNSHCVITNFKNSTVKFNVLSTSGRGREVYIGRVEIPLGEHVESTRPVWVAIDEPDDVGGFFSTAKKLDPTDVFTLGSLLVGLMIFEPWKLQDSMDELRDLENQLTIQSMKFRDNKPKALTKDGLQGNRRIQRTVPVPPS